MKIGERIRNRRIEIGMTQEELAQKLGYKGKSSINKIECGAQDLPQKKIAAIASALSTTPEFIMGWEDDTEENKSYYLNDEVKELAQFLMKNPEYKVLFDASRKVKASDINLVMRVIEKFGEDDDK